MNKKTIIGIIIAFVIGTIVGIYLHNTARVVAAVYSPDTNSATQFTNVNITGSSTLQVGIPNNFPPTAAPFGPAICQAGNNATSTAICTVVTAGNLSFGSTTLAVIPNPYGATSTITNVILSGGNGTTSISLQVGTTTGNGSPASGLSSTLVNTTVATTSQYYISNNAVGASYYAGANTFTQIVVAPNESIVIVATSTTGTFTLGNTGPIFPTATTSGSYKIEWQR